TGALTFGPRYLNASNCDLDTPTPGALLLRCQRNSGSLGPAETNHGLRDRASLSWRHKGSVREVDRSRPSKQGQPPGGPDLPCGRAICRWLDDNGCPRFEGKLGAI